MDTYKILRYFLHHKNPIIMKTGLTFDEARTHCLDLQTSSKTATNPEAVAFTQEYGEWVDRWIREEKEDDDDQCYGINGMGLF